ncbi:MAG: glutaredoxin family protein [Candidatus Bathyarchaeota archaeon]|nr:glutaredoxin family protein [Candidatus Bathyarchaeota archaeon]
MNTTKVEGTNKQHKVFVYALSTCGWCKKSKQYLKDNNIEYQYLDVDTCTREDRQKAINDLKNRNAPVAFPAIIIDEKLISGFKKQDLDEALNL